MSIYSSSTFGKLLSRRLIHKSQSHLPHFPKNSSTMVKKQIIPWLCLILSAQAIAFTACQSSTSEPATDPIKGGLSTGMNFNGNKQSNQKHENKRGMEVAVVHERKGAYGGTVLTKPRKTQSGASGLPVTLAHITLSVCVVVSYLFLLS